MDSNGRELTRREAMERKRLYIASLMIFIGIPVVIALGVLVLPKELYMLLSIVVLCMTMAPFFMVFESRKPKAREIVLLAMVSALTAGAHIFLHIVLPVQIGTALVIIGGISLGPEAGFLIGALSRFVCNFYMGQGPWTPWQMFCWGLLGFLAGLAFNRGNMDSLKSRSFKVIVGPVLTIAFALLVAYASYMIYPGEDESFFGWRLYAFGVVGLIAGVVVQKKRLPIDGLTISLFTFFTSFIIYGGIMNAASLIMTMNANTGETLSLDALRALYISGLPYDMLHAGTAAICVFLFGESIITKLERIKIKYGIYK